MKNINGFYFTLTNLQVCPGKNESAVYFKWEKNFTKKNGYVSILKLTKIFCATEMRGMKAWDRF